MTSPWWLYSGIVPIVSSHARPEQVGPLGDGDGLHLPGMMTKRSLE
jgi:hypothetical protein